MRFLEVFLAGPYNIALTVGVVVSLLLAVRAGSRAGFAPLSWHVVLVAGLTAGLAGSTFIFLDFHAPRLGEKSNLGGLIAGIAIVVLLANWMRIGVWRALDAMAVPTLVGMAIGRVGCFLAGCCSGTHTGLPWGVHVEGESEAIHPVQLYEAFADLLLVGALARWVPIAKPGHRVGVAVLSYAGIRFATEFVRAGRTDIAGLNPVQWSLLAIGGVVALWMWRRAAVNTIAMQDAPRALATAAAHSEHRAFTVAMLMLALSTSVVIGLPAVFAPFEAVFLLATSFGLATYAVLRYPPRWLARPLMPSLCALFLLDTPADSVARKREVVIGGGILSGRVYNAVVGETRSTYTSCEGDQVMVTPTLARRRSITGWLSAGVRGHTKSGNRVMVEGQLVTGKDNLHLLTDGPVFGEVPNSTSILAGGAIFSLESRNQHLRVNVLGGNMSELGAGAQTFTGSVTARHGVEGGFFLEGNLAEPRWFATTGDFSYAGLGYVVTRAGARVLVGAGSGAYLGVHVPVRGFELDVTAREMSPTAKLKNPSGFVSIGLKKVFTLR